MSMSEVKAELVEKQKRMAATLAQALPFTPAEVELFFASRGTVKAFVEEAGITDVFFYKLINSNPELLPAQFRRVRYEVDKDAVRQMLESGAQLSFARLGERGTSIRIR